MEAAILALGGVVLVSLVSEAQPVRHKNTGSQIHIIV
jgi:hypothetical protein